MALVSIVTQQCKQAVIEFHSNETVDYRLLSESTWCASGLSQSIVGSSELQFSDGLCAEVLF
jgi:hypothetical protein